MTISQHFERKSRDNGEAFYSLSDDAPAWLYDAVQEAHDGELPNDWRYDTCHSIASAIDDGSDDSTDIADGLADVYSGELLTWVADNLNRIAYCDEALENGADTFMGAIMCGQSDAIRVMVDIMLDAIDENVCDECGDPNAANGEGWNGLCGNCADRAENADES